MDQQLFSRPSRVIGLHGIHFPGSQISCTRNSCNFCLDNSFTSPTLFVAVVHVTRIVCSVVIFFFFPLHQFSILKRVCICVGRSCIVEVTRKGEPEGRRRGEDAAKMRSNVCAQRRKRGAHKIPSREGKGRDICVFPFVHPLSPLPCFAATSKTVPVLLSDAGTTNTAEN